MAKPPLAHILIVEDDSELLEVLQFVLEDGGYEVTVASNGADALETIDDKPVDLVVLDVNLNGMSGLDVARQIRSKTDVQPPLIALHTGLEETVVRKEFSDYDLFMPKGDDADVLLTLIAKALEGTTSEPTRRPGPAG